MKHSLSYRIWNIIKESRQFRDGRWLWLRILNKNDIADAKRILVAKRKPKIPLEDL